MTGFHPNIAPGDHKSYMLYAVEQARLSPPSPSKFCVGAVLVDADKNEVLSTGYSEELPGNRPNYPGSIHAEHCCFIQIGDAHEMSDFYIAKVLPPTTVLYTTMEPCNERLNGNRTCTERIIGLEDAIRPSTLAFGNQAHSSSTMRASQGLRKQGSRSC
ncbi:Cytidine deaminase-like protein [Rhypophila sp. PSN 637]